MRSERAALVEVQAEPWPWPLLGPADPSAVALLLIDMQVDFVRQGGWFAAHGFDLSPVRAIVPRLQRLLAAAREVPGLHIVHTRQGKVCWLPARSMASTPNTSRTWSTRRRVSMP
jgi:hypothetical protein